MEVDKIKKKTVFSTLSLFFQSGYSAFLGLIANLVLTIVLSPKIFGIYITLLSGIAFLNYFSDIGLAASLIQKKQITDDDTKSVFTLQQILVLTLITIGFFLGPKIIAFYKLPDDGLWLYYALLISFFISSLKTIPSVFLERNIAYQKIVLVQIVESTFFYLSVIVLALLHFQLWSFTIAVILRAIVGLIFIYILCPWTPKIGIVKNNIRQLISFGLPFQAGSFLALFKDDLIILYLSKVIGFEAVGYIGWAKKWAEAPIRIIMDNINKVLFPLIARLQDNKEKIGRVVEKILYYQTATIFPIMIVSFFLMEKLVYLIPRYQKWAVALPVFKIFVVSSFLVIYLAPFINLFNALGKAKISFQLMLFWTAITWIFTVILTGFFGTFGFPITHLFISLSFIIPLYLAKKEINFSFIKPIKIFFISGLVTILGLIFINRIQINNLYWSTTALLATATAIYLFCVIVVFKIKPIEEIKHLTSSV
jgi:O-antigen/teichoic acid export membrane protein